MSICTRAGVLVCADSRVPVELLVDLVRCKN